MAMQQVLRFGPAPWLACDSEVIYNGGVSSSYAKSLFLAPLQTCSAPVVQDVGGKAALYRKAPAKTSGEIPCY